MFVFFFRTSYVGLKSRQNLGTRTHFSHRLLADDKILIESSYYYKMAEIKKIENQSAISKFFGKKRQMYVAILYLYVDLEIYITVMALVGFSASAVQALTYQNGDYMGSLNKKASGAQCFIMALGLFLGYRNWPTLNTQWRRLSWT